MAGDPGVSAGFGSCLTLFLWVVSLSSPEAGLPRGQTSSYTRRHDEPASAQNSVLSPAGSGIGLSRCEVAQLLCFFFVLFWQNQLLAKGLLFVEEKIKLCEGKYEAALTEWGPCDSAFDVWAAEVLLS